MALDEKLAFLRESRHAFGRTALVLSGGGSFGSFHMASERDWRRGRAVLGVGSPSPRCLALHTLPTILWCLPWYRGTA